MKRRTARRPATSKSRATPKRRTAVKRKSARIAAPRRRVVHKAAKRTTARRKNPSAEAKIIGSKTTRSTVRGTTIRRRFLLVKQGHNLAWIEALHANGFGGFVDAPGNDAREVRAGSISNASALAAFRAYVARRGSAW